MHASLYVFQEAASAKTVPVISCIKERKTEKMTGTSGAEKNEFLIIYSVMALGGTRL